MPHYLQHYFNPDFDHTALRPVLDNRGQADRYNLGYVQNVIKGQVLAELLPLEAVPYPNERFILSEPRFPMGPKTRVDPEHPHYLLADTNGYVFYYNGTIAVKNLLNVRKDVDFHTGNIVFVGDMAVHHDLKPGFEIQSNNMLIKGMVEGGIARSRKSMVVQGGVRGCSGNRCLVTAGGNLRLAFAESAELRSEGKLFIERFCLHSTVYSRGAFVVGDRLIGGTCRARSLVYVRGELGNKAGVATTISLGRDPAAVRLLERCDARMAALKERIGRYGATAGHMPSEGNETSRKLNVAYKKYAMLKEQRDTLSRQMESDTRTPAASKLVVKGRVYPGVTVSIANAARAVPDVLSNVCFSLLNDEIVIRQAS